MAAFEAQTYSTPGFLAVGKFQRFESMFFPQGTWRIGTVADGSCFFHSLLTATDRDYRALTKLEDKEKADTARCRAAKTLRSTLSKKITQQLWDTLQSGEPRHFSFILSLRAVESLVVNCLADKNKMAQQPWLLKCFAYNESALRTVTDVLGTELIDLDSFSNDCKNAEGGYKAVGECNTIFFNTQISRYVKTLSDNIRTHVKKRGMEHVRGLRKRIRRPHEGNSGSRKSSFP